MDTDAEYKAYEAIVRNDKRQRWATFLLMVTFIVAIFLAVLTIAQTERNLVQEAQKDNRIRTEEARRYTTCLLLIPLEQRNVEGQKYCFESSDLPGGRDPSEFMPVQKRGDDGSSLNKLNEVLGLYSLDESYLNSTRGYGLAHQDSSHVGGL